MKCPYCEYEESKVVDSRPTDEGEAIRRRRECLSCGKRFTTYEKVENVPLMVVKKDGSRQLFDSRKILNGLVRACEKRPVSIKEMERVVAEIEAELQNRLQREISTQEIGEMVLGELRKIDEVAYVRFASVYRQFKDVDSFLREIKALTSDENR